MALLSGAWVVFLLWTDPPRDESLTILTVAVSIPIILVGSLYGILTYPRRGSRAFIRTIGSATFLGLLSGVIGGAIGGAIAFSFVQTVPLE
jgi:hypothetical protein